MPVAGRYGMMLVAYHIVLTIKKNPPTGSKKNGNHVELIGSALNHAKLGSSARFGVNLKNRAELDHFCASSARYGPNWTVQSDSANHG